MLNELSLSPRPQSETVKNREKKSRASQPQDFARRTKRNTDYSLACSAGGFGGFRVLSRHFGFAGD